MAPTTPQLVSDWLELQPHLGWQVRPTPVTALPELASALGLGWLGVKRDDLSTVLHGGTKVRKLDALLASEPWYSAPKWTTTGALGSGHLVACTAAAEAMGREIAVDIFGEPLVGPAWRTAEDGQPRRHLSAGVRDNLAFTANHASEVHWHRNRATLALTAAPLLLRPWFRGGAVIAPGATQPQAMVGMLRAAFELAGQIARGELPMPSRLYVALGSGGTAAGLAVGLALAGLPLTVHAVRTVEAPLAPPRRVQQLIHQLWRWLQVHGVALPATPQAVPVVVDGSQIGRGYGWPTAASQQARMRMQQLGIPSEDVYTGKAWAALLADAHRRVDADRTWLFWNTVRGPLTAEPLRPAVVAAMPRWLRHRLAALDPAEGPSQPVRRWLLGAAGVGGLGWLAWRTLEAPHDRLSFPWRGRVLDVREATTVQAAAQALVAPQPGDAEAWQVAVAVDHYVAHLPAAKQRLVRGMLWAVEHGHGGWRRFSLASAAARRDHLVRLRRWPGLARDLSLGLRDLVMLGWYQQPAAWSALGYGGPLVGGQPRPPRAAYARLQAAAGQLPAGAVRGEWQP